MERVTGKPYKASYRPVSEARELEARAKAENNVELETAASHRLVQGTEGTLLPQPWDNSKFPEQAVKVVGIEEGLKKARSVGLSMSKAGVSTEVFRAPAPVAASRIAIAASIESRRMHDTLTPH